MHAFRHHSYLYHQILFLHIGAGRLAHGFARTLLADTSLLRSGASNPMIPTKSGVPQGSVLGPLLFTAYMSPISRVIASHGVGQHHYADDTTLSVELSGPSDLPSTHLNNCLTDIVG